MRSFLVFLINFSKALILKNRRYIRLTPIIFGKIFLFDKKKNVLFSLYSNNKIDTITIDQIYTYHDYDLTFLNRYSDIYNRYKEIFKIHKKPLIIDCGANIGVSSKYFAEEFLESKVIAIEPEKQNFSNMKRNCKKNNNIIFEHSSIGSKKGYSKIINEDAEPNMYRTEIIKDTGGIKILTINDIYKEYQNCLPFIVKIDIEGFEKNLFESNTDWIKITPLIIIETHDWMIPGVANSRNFLKAISCENRDFVHKGENIFSISNDIFEL